MNQLSVDGLKLLRLAARSVRPVVKGCAKELHFVEAAPGRFSVAHGDSARKKAIDVFGPGIAARWDELLKDYSTAERAAAMEQLANLPADEVRAAVAEELAGADSADVDVWAATEYLKAIPPTAAASMAGQAEIAATIDALRVLPKDVPPFPPGTHLLGTPYLLKSVLGSGGFGAVYKAVNQFEQHGEPRALKFCLDPAMIATLQRERVLLDRLMASGRESNWSSRIVKLYGHALDVEIPFLVYEYVAGGSLPFCLKATRRKIERNLRPDEVLGLIRQIVEGLAFAHDLGLVHRDVKPANILVYRGQTKLADFGIGGVVSRHAVRQSASDYLSMSEMSVDGRNSLFRGSGTPLYMSPEQRRGDEPLPHHDIYSLGVMWYQLLTGDITRPLHPGWDEELRDEFSAPEDQIALIRSCVGYYKNRPNSARQLLESLPKPAPARVAAPRKQLPAGRIVELGKHAKGVCDVACDADGSRAVSCGRDSVARLWDLRDNREVFRFEGHAGPVCGCAFDGDLATTIGEDETIRRWCLTSGEETSTFVGRWPGITCAVFHPTLPWCATADEKAGILLWNYEEESLVAKLRGHRGLVRSLDISNDGSRVVSGADDSTVRLWDVQKSRELHCDRSHRGPVTAVRFTNNTQRIVSCGESLMRYWSSRSSREILRFQGVLRPVDCAAFAASDELLITGSRDAAVRVWELQHGRLLHRFEGHRNWVTCLAACGEDQALSGGLDGALYLWRLTPSAGNAP